MDLWYQIPSLCQKMWQIHITNVWPQPTKTPNGQVSSIMQSLHNIQLTFITKPAVSEISFMQINVMHKVIIIIENHIYN